MEIVKDNLSKLFNSGMTITSISKVFNVSRQTIHKYCDRFDLIHQYNEVVTCVRCERQFKSRIKLHSKYCPGCYRLHLIESRISDSYNEMRLKGLSVRQWQRKSRVIAKQIIGKQWQSEFRVHHNDGDITNNEPCNLFVFFNHSLHMAYHHAIKGNPIKKPISYSDGIQL